MTTTIDQNSRSSCEYRCVVLLMMSFNITKSRCLIARFVLNIKHALRITQSVAPVIYASFRPEVSLWVWCDVQCHISFVFLTLLQKCIFIDSVYLKMETRRTTKRASVLFSVHQKCSVKEFYLHEKQYYELDLKKQQNRRFFPGYVVAPIKKVHCRAFIPIINHERSLRVGEFTRTCETKLSSCYCKVIMECACEKERKTSISIFYSNKHKMVKRYSP